MKDRNLVNKLDKSKKLYIFTDNTLSPIYAAVQGGHAACQYILETYNRNDSWKNETIVYLSAQLDEVIRLLKSKNIRYTIWREPDMNNAITAIAVYHYGITFKKYKTLRV
jgi:hypothetical protein